MHKSIHAAAAEVKLGEITPRELLSHCWQRIDRMEPRIHAWVLVDRERAQADAEQLTRELESGQWRGPLHGIPLAIKDIFDVFDWPTAAGSKRWAQSYARRDATAVAKLRQAGAVLIGKTVTTQYASFDPPVTRNPWDLSRTPGGSSSGSAAAVACCMCLGALGSQTGGSITRPASYCGVAGCKPTFGRVSTTGVVPLAHSMDHIGPIARNVRDLAVLLQAIAGADPADPLCSSRPVPDVTQALTGARKPPVLGRVRGLFEERADAAVHKMMDEISSAWRGHGARIIDLALPASFATVVPRHRTVMAVEAAQFHRSRLERYPDDYRPNIRALLEEGLACSATDYAASKEHQRLLTQEMLGCFDGVDALLTPATTSPAPDSSTTGNPSFNSPWSYTGLPTVSFPCAKTPEGLPLAVQLVGKPWSEPDLLSVGVWCEETLNFEIGDPA